MHKLAAAIASSVLLCAASASADDAPTVSARVVSYESTESLARKACALVGVAEVGGHARLFDIAVDGERCSSLPPQADAIPLRVTLEPQSNGWSNVVFEADVPEGATESQMRAAVDGAARELFDRLGGARRRAAPLARDADPAPKSSSAHTAGTVLLGLGGASAGAAAIIGIAAMIDAAGHSFGCTITAIGGGSCGSQDLSAYGIGAGITGGLGVVLLITGAIVLSAAPNKAGLSALLGPTGGSLRITF